MTVYVAPCVFSVSTLTERYYIMSHTHQRQTERTMRRDVDNTWILNIHVLSTSLRIVRSVCPCSLIMFLRGCREARNSCRQQIAQCVVRILLRATSGTPLMFRGNRENCAQQMLLHATDIAYDTLCDSLPATLLRCCSNKVA